MRNSIRRLGFWSSTACALLIFFLQPASQGFGQELIPEAALETRQELLNRITQNTPVAGIAITFDGILAGASDALRVWDGISGTSLISLTGLYGGSFQAAAFSKDGTSIVGLTRTGEMNSWSMSPIKFKGSFVNNGNANAVAYSPDDKVVVSAGADAPPLKVWDAETGRLIRGVTLPGVNEIRSVAFAPDGSLLACAAQRSVILLKTSDWSIVRTIEAHTQPINAVAFSPDGNVLATASDDQIVRLWKIESGEMTRELKGHTAAVRSVAFSHDGGMIASGSLDKTVRVWTKEGTSAGRIAHPRAVYAVAFTEADSELVTAAADNTVRQWRVSDWKLTQRLVPPQPSSRNVFLYEQNQSAVPATAPQNTRPFAPSRQNDGRPKTNAEVSTLAEQILQLVRTDQIQALEAMLSADFSVDGAAGATGPTSLQDREGARIRLFDSNRLRTLIVSHFNQRNESRSVAEIQRFRSLRDIFRGDELAPSVQILDRVKRGGQEDAATIVFFWNNDPMNYGLAEYPQFGVARTKGAWNIVDLTLPLDLAASSRFAIVEQRIAQIRGIANSFVKNLVTGPNTASIIQTIARDHQDALALEIEFPKSGSQWSAATLNNAEIVLRWDGDPSDYDLKEYPRIRLTLEDGSWKVER